MRLGKPELPRKARVVDRALRRGARAAVVAGNEDDLTARLRDARGDRADARLGDELNGNTRAAVGVFKVIDQLCQVFDRIDVVMRRRGNQCHAGRGIARLCNPRIDLLARKMAALAGLCALRHFDLDLFGVDQILARHAEAARGDLLDRAGALRSKAFGAFAALAGVRLAAQTVHRDGHALVRFL